MRRARKHYSAADWFGLGIIFAVTVLTLAALFAEPPAPTQEPVFFHDTPPEFPHQERIVQWI